MADPVLTINSPTTITIDENVAQGDHLFITPDVTFSDADGDFDGGRLVVGGLLTGDMITVRNTGTGPGQLMLVSGVLSYGGIAIGDVVTTYSGSFTIVFNANATSESIEALIDHLQFRVQTDNPAATRDLVIQVVDSAGNPTEVVDHRRRRPRRRDPGRYRQRRRLAAVGGPARCIRPLTRTSPRRRGPQAELAVSRLLAGRIQGRLDPACAGMHG